MESSVEKLNRLIALKESLICLGLDPEIKKMPLFYQKSPEPIFEFCNDILSSLHPFISAIKPNFAFFEAEGIAGLQQLKKIMNLWGDSLFSIADIKRADIGNTSRLYAEAYFNHWNFDAITVPPYMGEDSILPFAQFEKKLTFVLCLTSNLGSKDFEEQHLSSGKQLYLEVLDKVKKWNHNGNLGLVVGATKPDQLNEIRRLEQMAPILIPGVGAQGGDLEEAITLGLGEKSAPALINIGRAILYPEGNYLSREAYLNAVIEKAREYHSTMARFINSK
ncbi:MAG: orotidine-5'-phosphate decarboxylase [Chloroherpetonaceae bacterium]|nr:orotidine-5'-phosphate decarboxylase [Chloroherpetonaceae bacterium]